LFLIGAFSLNVFAGFEDRKFQDSGHNIAKNAFSILIEKGICSDENDCNKKEIFFYGGISSGIEIYIYGVLDQDVISNILESCSDEYVSSGRKMNIKLHGVSATKKQDMDNGIFGKNSEFLTVNFKGI